MHKKIALLLAFAGLFQISQAQISELWGVTRNGSDDNSGTIYKTDGDGNNFSLEYSLKKFNANNPIGGFTEAPDGNLYAVSQNGGLGQNGTIFKLDPTTEEIEIVYMFLGPEGKNPINSLTLASNGKLIGITQYGGASNFGVIYEYDFNTNTVIVLHEFPSAGLAQFSIVEGADGMYYGLTVQGGTFNNGAIYSFDPITSVYSELYSFDTGTGSIPTGRMIQASNGKLYGQTVIGGLNNNGVIFEYDLALSQYTVLHHFDDIEGSYPSSTLLELANGKLVSTTRQGGAYDKGVLYEYDFTTGFSVLSDLTLRHQGELIETSSNVVLGAHTDPYGSYGKFFIYDFNTSQISLSASYAGAQGIVYSYFYQIDSQHVYALTMDGGLTDDGTAIKYDFINDNILKIKDFNFAIDGEIPDNQMVHAGAKMFYGVCYQGGASNLGVIFSYDGQTGTYQKLHDFDGATGKNPSGTMLLANNGLLYGTTKYGGLNDRGVLFSFDMATNTFTKLHDFDVATGYYPNGELIQATDGKLYGMCYQGGLNTVGVIYDFDIVTSTYQDRFDFEYTIAGVGRFPEGGLTEGTDNMLYGLTKYSDYSGGQDYGAIIEFNAVTGQLTKLHNFDQTNGERPLGNVVFDDAGIMYGSTSIGGTNGIGVLFSYDTLTDIFTKIHDFSSTTGINPKGRITKGLNNKLYGIAAQGGSSNGGVLFEYDPQISALVIKKHFDYSSGMYLWSSPVEVLICMPTTGVDVQEGCDEYIWMDGLTYYSDNSTATYALTGSLGCDSIVTLNLTMKYSSTEIDARSECSPYTWMDGNIYTADESAATHTIQNAAGCDSVITLNLTILEATSATQTETALDAYTWPVNNQTYTSSGQYTAVIPNVAGCDSTITLDLTLNFTGLAENEVATLSLYPNPTNGAINLKSELPLEGSYFITDLNGRVLQEGELLDGENVIQLETLNAGTYFIRFSNYQQVMRFIKN